MVPTHSRLTIGDHVRPELFEITKQDKSFFVNNRLQAFNNVDQYYQHSSQGSQGERFTLTLPKSSVANKTSETTGRGNPSKTASDRMVNIG